MRLVVFGATGKTGHLLLGQALDAGNEVVAYVRNPSKLNASSERLKVVQGELQDERRIEGALEGADAVLSVLGPKGSSKSKPLTKGMEVIIAAMKKQGVRRIIITSTLSAKDPRDQPDLKAKVLVSIVRSAMRGAYEEIVGVARIVRESDLDWTIVRLTMLNNGASTGKVRVGYLGRGQVGSWVSRANVAEFMLKEVRDQDYVRGAPAISN